MLSLLINHICCDIDRLGSFNVPISKLGTKLEVTLPSKTDYDYFIVMSNPKEDLQINGEDYSSNVIRINAGFILFKVTNDFILNFTVFQLPIKCDSREFIINPREGESYIYNSVEKKLTENSNYCLVVAGENDFDLTVSKGTPNTNEISYSQFDLSNGASIAAGESKKISSTFGVCLCYTATSSDETVLSVVIDKDNHNSETPSTIVAYDYNGYGYIAQNGISVMDFSHSLNLGLNKLIVENSSVLYRIQKSSYIVFTEFKGISGKLSILGGKTQEILGTTKIVAVYFNSTALLSLQTNETTPQSCRLVYYKVFPSNCDMIFTISGEGSIEDEAENNETICVATAFSSGKAKVKVEGNYNSFQADGVTTTQSLRKLADSDSESLEFSSAVAFNFSAKSGDDEAEFKISVKTDSDDKSTKYIIKKDNEYKSYYYAGKEFGQLNGKPDSKKSNQAVVIVIIGISTVVLLVVAVAIFICIRRRMKKNENAEETTQSEKYNELNDNFAEPLVDAEN